MISILNTGNILPLYQRLEDQNRYIGNCPQRIGLIAQLGFGLPFQYITDVNVSNVVLSWLDERGNSIAASGYSLDLLELSNGNTVITYYGGGIDGLNMDGYYTLVMRVNNNTYFFEEQKLVSDISCYHQIAFTNDCNLEGIYYDNNYGQRFFFEGRIDQPIIEREEETLINGLNESVIKSSNVKHRYQVVAPCLMDAILYPLSLIRDHSSILYYPDDSGVVATNLKEFDIAFTPQQGGCYSSGAISFLCDNFSNAGCCDDTLSVVNQQTITG